VQPGWFPGPEAIGVRFQENIRGEKNIVTTPADHPEENTATQKTKMKREEHTSTEHSVDKFADARRAKKREKRKRHRAKLKRSHTGG
jgi:hypothetical protein